MEKHIQLPITRDMAREIKSGDACLLSGVIYTARDAAHKRLCALLDEGRPLPFDVRSHDELPHGRLFAQDDRGGRNRHDRQG